MSLRRNQRHHPTIRYKPRIVGLTADNRNSVYNFHGGVFLPVYKSSKLADIKRTSVMGWYWNWKGVAILFLVDTGCVKWGINLNVCIEGRLLLVNAGHKGTR